MLQAEQVKLSPISSWLVSIVIGAEHCGHGIDWRDMVRSLSFVQGSAERRSIAPARVYPQPYRAAPPCPAQMRHGGALSFILYKEVKLDPGSSPG